MNIQRNSVLTDRFKKKSEKLNWTPDKIKQNNFSNSYGIGMSLP